MAGNAAGNGVFLSVYRKSDTGQFALPCHRFCDLSILATFIIPAEEMNERVCLTNMK